MKFEIVVTHRAAPELLNAIRRHTDALAGLLPEQQPKIQPQEPEKQAPDYEIKFREWVGLKVGEEAGHCKALFAIVTGRRKEEAPWTRASAREFLIAAGAPLP